MKFIYNSCVSGSIFLGGSGSWSMRGCRNVSGPNDDVIQCQCDHLTHFGYLLVRYFILCYLNMYIIVLWKLLY